MDKPADYDTAYDPVIEKVIKELKRGDATQWEVALSFLEHDPYYHGSGYLKQAIWKCLLRATLTKEQKRRLLSVALHYVNTRVSWEFFPMCRFVISIADTAFKEEIERLTTSDVPMVKRRALLLHAYFDGIPNGERYRRSASMECYIARTKSHPGVKKPGKPRWKKNGQEDEE